MVGVVELDFLEPIHNKQDFNKTDRYKYEVLHVLYSYCGFTESALDVT